MVHDFLDHALKEVLFGRGRVSVQQTVGFYEGDRGQSAVVNGGEEVRGILDMGGSLHRVTHDRVSVRLEVADVAVAPPYLHSRIGARWIVLERLADCADIARWDGTALCDSGRVYIAVGQKARVVVVDHIEVVFLAVWIRMVRQRRQIVADRIDTGL